MVLISVLQNSIRFDNSKTLKLLEQLLWIDVDKDAASLLVENTEGWVTGIRLAGLSMRHRDNAQEMLIRLSTENRYVWDYLISEVPFALKPEIQDFLFKTAVLDRFCASLCDADLGDSGTQGEAPLTTSASGSQAILET